VAYFVLGLLEKALVLEDNEAINSTRTCEDTNISFQFDDSYRQEVEEGDGERVDAIVELAHRPCKFFSILLLNSNNTDDIYVILIFSVAPRCLRTLTEMGENIGHPELSDLVAIFLFQQRNPGIDIPEVSKCPKVLDQGYSYNSAVATFYAPSDLSGANGMHHQHIHASSSWRNGLPHYDCVFVEKDPTLPGFQGLFVAQVLLLFSFHYRNVYYPCALVQWFTPDARASRLANSSHPIWHQTNLQRL